MQVPLNPVYFLWFEHFSEALIYIWSGLDYQDFQMNLLKHDKIKILEIKILKAGKKQDIPS